MRMVRDIHISNCEFTSLCAVIRIGLKSIGDIYNVVISNCTMEKTHFRFGNDIMGEAKFEGIRIDAETHRPIRGVTMENIRYHNIGGVKKADIPEQYPEVLDRLQYPNEKGFA